MRFRKKFSKQTLNMNWDLGGKKKDIRCSPLNLSRSIREGSKDSVVIEILRSRRQNSMREKSRKEVEHYTECEVSERRRKVSEGLAYFRSPVGQTENIHSSLWYFKVAYTEKEHKMLVRCFEMSKANIMERETRKKSGHGTWCLNFWDRHRTSAESLGNFDE